MRFLTVMNIEDYLNPQLSSALQTFISLLFWLNFAALIVFFSATAGCCFQGKRFKKSTALNLLRSKQQIKTVRERLVNIKQLRSKYFPLELMDNKYGLKER